MRTPTARPTRRGISLLEVLISVGIIALGIFGVASLIPVAQFRVEQGISAERQATLGNRAVAEFRIRNMGSPRNWKIPNASVAAVFNNQGEVIRRGYCLDPVGLLGWTTSSPPWFFPSGSSTGAAMPRITLNNITPSSNSVEANRDLARTIFDLRDDLVFDIPAQEERAARRRFFVNPNDGTPIRESAEGMMSWFATITPTIANLQRANDSYLLSIVVVKNRLTAPTEESLASAAPAYSDDGQQYFGAGEVTLSDIGSPSSDQIRVADLRVGDWILLAKSLVDQTATPPTTAIAYRWTKIIGADEKDRVAGVARNFTIANNDFFRPNAAASEGQAMLVRGVSGVYERTIRLQTASAWD